MNTIIAPNDMKNLWQRMAEMVDEDPPDHIAYPDVFPADLAKAFAKIHGIRTYYFNNHPRMVTRRWWDK